MRMKICKKKRNIAILDSGLGGLTILMSIAIKCPQENFIYFADTAQLPYGNKNPADIIHCTLKCIKYIVKSKNPKLIILACSTMTSNAIAQLAVKFKTRILGVIKPEMLEIPRNLKIKSIAILGTKATIKTKIYGKVFPNYTSKKITRMLNTQMLVPILEEGLASSPIVEYAINYYINQLPIYPNCIILGCTHYPLLEYYFSKILPKNTIIINGATSIAKYFIRNSENNLCQITYLVTGCYNRFKKLVFQLLGIKILKKHVKIIKSLK